MSKSFTQGLDSLMPTGDGGKRGPGRPVKRLADISKTSQEGLPENETRATFIVEEELLEKIKGIAYWDRRKIRAVHTEALRRYVQEWEKTNGGPVKEIPKENK